MNNREGHVPSGVPYVTEWYVLTSFEKEDEMNFFFFFDLLFNVHSKHLRSCRDGQLT